MTGLRLDRFMWFARLAKSRTLAQKMIHAGEVRVDGDRVTSNSMTICPGQTLTLTSYQRFRVIRVDALPARRGPATEAQACYTELVASQPIDGAPE